MTPPNPDKPRYPLAPWRRRIGAYLIDLIVLFVLFMVLVAVLYYSINYLTDDLNPSAIADVSDIVTVCAVVLVLVIWGLVEGKWYGKLGKWYGKSGKWYGKSGKALTGLKVVSADDHTQTIGIARGIVRVMIKFVPPLSPFVVLAVHRVEELRGGFPEAVKVISGVLLIVWLLDLLWPLWAKERQMLHDKAAKSHVIFKEL